MADYNNVLSTIIWENSDQQLHSEAHNTTVPSNFLPCFNEIKKCMSKFDNLVNEILCIQDLKPALNVEFDSLRVKGFM